MVGATKAEPRADAVEDRGAGSAGVAGEGDAAWRRRLAPRRRDAVKRYFTTGPTGK